MDMIANRTMQRVDMLDRNAFQNSWFISTRKRSESAYFVERGISIPVLEFVCLFVYLEVL